MASLKREMSPKIALLLSTQVPPNLTLLEAMEKAQCADASEAEQQRKHNKAVLTREWRDRILAGMNAGTTRHEKATAKQEKAVAKEQATQAALTKAVQQKTKAHAKLDAEKKKRGKKKADDAMSALTGGLFDPVPLNAAAAQVEEEQEGEAMEVGEREEETSSTKAITTDEGADKRARVLSSVASVPFGTLTFQDMLGNRDVASHLLGFTSSPLHVASTSRTFIPLVELALTRLTVKLTQDLVPANALTINTRFPLLCELTLECSEYGYEHDSMVGFFTQAVVQSSLRERLNYLKFNFHVTVQSATLDAFFTAPWPNLRSVGGEFVLSGLLSRARRHPGSLDRIEFLLGSRDSIPLTTAAIRDNILPGLLAVEALKDASWPRDPQLCENIIQVLRAAPQSTSLNLRLNGSEANIPTFVQAVRAPPYLFSGLRNIDLDIFGGPVSWELLTALGTVGTVPRLETLCLSWEPRDAASMPDELEPQAWPTLSFLKLTSCDLDTKLGLLTNSFRAAGSSLKKVVFKDWGRGNTPTSVLTHVLSLLKDDDLILWRDSLVSLSFPRFNRSHGAPSEMCRNIKAALLRLPRLQELALSLGSLAAVLALVETIEAGALPDLTVLDFNDVVLNNEALFLLVAWLKLERDGLAAQLHVKGIIVHQSFYRDLINGIGLTRLQLLRW